MRIRRYRRKDAKALVGLVRALADYESLTPPTPAANRRLVSDVGRRIEVFIAEEGGKPVGYAMYFFTYSSFLARPTLYLEDVFVRPEHRGGGIGKAFFKALRKEADRKKCGRMEWTVLDWNTPSIKFYRKLGAKLMKEWIICRQTLRSS